MNTKNFPSSVPWVMRRKYRNKFSYGLPTMVCRCPEGNTHHCKIWSKWNQYVERWKFYV